MHIINPSEPPLLMGHSLGSYKKQGTTLQISTRHKVKMIGLLLGTLS